MAIHSMMVRGGLTARGGAGLLGLVLISGCAVTNTAKDVEDSLSTPAPVRAAARPVEFVAQSSVVTLVEDPFAVSTSGLAAGTNTTGPTTPSVGVSAGAPAESEERPERAQNTPRAERNNADPTALHRLVMADALWGKAGDPVRGGGANFAQMSFSQEGADFDPDVSRDGRVIVFASTQHRPTSDIYVKNVGSRVVTQLTSDPANDVMPRISPDGARIAFASNRTGNWDIYVMPMEGGRAVQITSTSDVDLHPSWSADGTQLVFSRLGEVSGQWELWVTEAGNPGIARFIGYGLFPEWCPVGGTGMAGSDRIVFQKSRQRGDRSFGIWTLDYKNGQAANTTEIASDPNFACINPSWSKDGEWIAYATVPSPSQWNYRTGVKPPSADLWLVDLQGSNRINMTSGRNVNLMPTWGPENKLFFVSDRGGADNIWSMDGTAVIELAKANSRGSTQVAGPSKPAPEQAPAGPAAAPVATVPNEGGGDH
jgi:hypothetical protein